jgi:hypothetical protein
MWTDGDIGGAALEARAFAHAQFNPDGGDDGTKTPCAVYLLGDSQNVAALRMAVVDSRSPSLPCTPMNPRSQRHRAIEPFVLCLRADFDFHS